MRRVQFLHPSCSYGGNYEKKKKELIANAFYVHNEVV